MGAGKSQTLLAIWDILNNEYPNLTAALLCTNSNYVDTRAKKDTVSTTHSILYDKENKMARPVGNPTDLMADVGLIDEIHFALTLTQTTKVRLLIAAGIAIKECL